ncbi:MAG: FtsX-like permease family protein [Synechococcales cyanobacterium CRU_2_2]|nr:FtsX-like permease family protein [Synechococcales cyanobacterium CRU_2_2]
MAIAFVVFLMFSQLSFRYAVSSTSAAFIRELDADLIMVHRNRRVSHLEITFDQSRLYQARGMAAVKNAYPLYITLGSWRALNAREERPIRIFAFNPEYPVFLTPEIKRAQLSLKTSYTTLADSRSKAVYGSLNSGIQAELSGHSVLITDTFTLGSNFVAEGNLIMGDQTFFNLFVSQPSGIAGNIRASPQQVDLGLIKLKSNADIEQVVQALNQELPTDVIVKTKQRLLEEEAKFWIRSTAIGFIFEMGTGLAFVVGIVMVYNIIYTNIDENVPQYGTLRAIGYPRLYLIQVVLLQSMTVAIAGFIPGFWLSVLLCRLISNATGLVLSTSSNTVHLVFLLTMSMCLISGFLASQKLRRLDPADVYG